MADGGGASDPALAVVLKGWPRLSETFIAQELKALEDRGLRFEIWSLRRPTDRRRHHLHDQVRARVRYLPEYVHEAPGRVFDAVVKAARLPGFGRALRVWWRDLRRDVSRNRVRRFAQACVLATESPSELRFLYAHFLHTPGSVARYAAEMRGLKWGFSAHARDIWTIPDWEKREKLAAATFGVACTAAGAQHLKKLAPEPGRVSRVYHGLDLSGFPSPPPTARHERNGADPQDPVRFVSVGRMVEKKGFDVLLEALTELPPRLHWRLMMVGSGPLARPLAKTASELGLSARISWRGAMTRDEVIGAMRWADLFVLASREASDGDRDGLPNVLLEAASQTAAIVSTRFSSIPEFVDDGVSGLLVKPGDPEALAAAMLSLARQPERRIQLSEAARRRLVADFAPDAGADAIADRLRDALAPGT